MSRFEERRAGERSEKVAKEFQWILHLSHDGRIDMAERFKLGVSISLALFGSVVASSGDLNRSSGSASAALGMTIILGAACISIPRAYLGKAVWVMAILWLLGRAFCVGPVEDDVWTVVCRNGEFRWVQRSPFAVKSLYDETLRIRKFGVTLIERSLHNQTEKQGSFSVHWSVAEQDLERYLATRDGRTVEDILEELFPADLGDNDLSAFKRSCRKAGVSVGGIYREL